MNGQKPISEVFWPLLAAVCDDTLIEAQSHELAAVLDSDMAARRILIDHVRLQIDIRLLCQAEKASDGSLARVRATFPLAVPSFPPLSFLSTTLHSTIDFFSQELPFSLLIATVLTSLGLWFASMIYVSSPDKIAKDSSPPVQSSFDPTLKVVGKITGMVDCKWADPATASVGDNVVIGHKFALASGLMEITYNTGAKVILQGPVTYEMESKNSGFLPVGKLTGKVETKAAKGFAVRTPSATVIDVGTEFGVVVRKDGGCEVQVFQGVVETVAMQNGKPIQQPCRLVEGQVAEVTLDDATPSRECTIAIAAKRADPDSFVRVMPATAQIIHRAVCDWRIGARDEFRVAKDDLVNAGQPTFSNIEIIEGKAKFYSDVHKLNDGKTYAGLGEEVSKDTFAPEDGAVVIMTLNTLLHPLGYDIKSIVSLTGSGGMGLKQDRSSQKYDVAYAVVGAPDKFIALRGEQKATVDCPAHGWAEEQTTLTGGGNELIASGVIKLRFTFHNTSSKNPESMYREIDIFGEPTAGIAPDTMQNKRQ